MNYVPLQKKCVLEWTLIKHPGQRFAEITDITQKCSECQIRSSYIHKESSQSQTDRFISLAWTHTHIINTNERQQSRGSIIISEAFSEATI